MEVFELVLVLLACVIASAILDQVIRRVSLPLIQIAVGLVVAVVMPNLAHVEVNPELFLVLFIAPLLFNEAREATKRELWVNKGAIISLAVGLVLLTVLVVGFALHWVVPSIPLAAAFACAAALGPTDAAAVGALGSTVKLSTRQRTLLSGESLINDASGVVSFQFAIAAALTGAFSAADATASFLLLFFGGIVAGALLGAIAFLSMNVVRRRGFENTTVHVLYEVFTPFVIFLAAEELGVSGILAVVAAGLVMAQHTPTLVSTEAARQQMVSESFWEIIVYLINGVIFVLLGIQLPQAFSPEVMAVMQPAALFGVVLLLTLLVMLCRFVWVTIMELQHVNSETGQRGLAHVGATLKDALVTTIAGPKGAVTLSIIMTIPLTMPTGEPFPNRALIIFLAAGVILLTLLVADTTLPLLAPKEADGASHERARRLAAIEVLKATVEELEAMIASGNRPEYEPALRLSVARCRTRLNRERFSLAGGFGKVMVELMEGALKAQQARADEIQLDPKDGNYDPKVAAPYYAMLRGIRSSVGYFDGAQNVGSHFHSLRGKLYLLKQRLFPTQVEDERTERIYYDTCLFAIDLEHAAIDYLEGEKERGDATRARAAGVLIDEHETALRSLWGRINYGQSKEQLDTRVYEHGVHAKMPQSMERNFEEQFAAARRYSDEVDALALSVEHDAIRKLAEEGAIDPDIARELREDVYLLQMQLG